VVVPTGSGGWYPRSFVLTDIVESVSLWERDPDQMAEAVARHDAIISREVSTANGTLVRSKGEGDSTFSVFSHPAEAVAAAAAIQGVVCAEEWPSATPLRIRAGVHTGDAEPRDGDWYGPAVNRAARLRALADGGQTLLSGVTAGLVADQLPGHSRLLYRGRRILRGIERPEEVWEIVAADDPRTAVPRLAKASDLPLSRTRFVGRALELALLDELLGQAWAGEPVTVLICGEAGAGKTRLIAKVAAAARDGGIHTLVGNCTVIGRTSLAFAPFAEVLRLLARDLPIGGPGRVPPRLVRLVAGPGHGAETPDSGPHLLERDVQLGLFAEVLETLEQAAAPSGLLLVIEDLHWADPSSRGLFEFLARNLRDAPVALVGTVRTDEPDDGGFLAWLAELQRAPRAARIDLPPFGREELAELLAGVLGERPSVELMGQVFERSGGNAFLAEELVAAGERALLVPATVRSLVRARMAGLTAPARDLLRLAAVSGVRVGHRLLAAAGGLGDDELVAAARELSGNHLLLGDRLGDGYVFRHALTRDAVYEDLLPGERQQLHRAVARALTDEPALGPPAGCAVAEAVAEHWFAAGELEPALAASVAAGNAAREVLAVTEALGHYERALELWDRVAEPETASGVGRPVLLERVADAASSAGQHDRAIRYVDAAIRELAQTAAPTQLGVLYAEKGWYGLRSGREGDWQEWTGRAAALVKSEPPTSEHAGILADHALALTSTERYEEASRVAVAALDVAVRAGARKCEVRARSALGLGLVMTSPDAEAGIRELKHAVAIAREMSDAETISDAYSNFSDALLALGRLGEAADNALEAAEIGGRLGAPLGWLAWNVLNAAEALFLAGRWDECKRALERLPDPRVGGLTEQWGLALTALLDASRGHNEAATAAVVAADNMNADDTQNHGMLLAAQAQIALNTSEIEAASRVALEALGLLAGSESEQDVVSAVTLTDLGLRIEADRAQLARTRGNPGGERDAVESARAVAARTAALRVRACAPAHRPDVTQDHQALCQAELSRAEGHSNPDMWRTAADIGVAQGNPYRTAYARFREAEAFLASRRDHALAVEALTMAHVIAGELGAEPLRREIEILARRARIRLTDDPATPSVQP
jgi:class 3 adenylate cyclase/tetratricopeptide (TPR) repeat protein